MMDEAAHPFGSIESALEFMVLLDDTIVEASCELQEMLGRASGERETEAVSLALFKMRQLSSHTKESRRILNDLRLIRGLLGKRGTVSPDSE